MTGDPFVVGQGSTSLACLGAGRWGTSGRRLVECPISSVSTSLPHPQQAHNITGAGEVSFLVHLC
jgi:hypothetical protein